MEGVAARVHSFAALPPSRGAHVAAVGGGGGVTVWCDVIALTPLEYPVLSFNFLQRRVGQRRTYA